MMMKILQKMLTLVVTLMIVTDEEFSLTTTLSIFKCDWEFMTTTGDLCLQYQTSQLYWVI